ncbi:hypothetical protein HWV62_2007 [Athelia sp. TMB]|nr:hypothetical protein HWV62_2007 [Athelia sp. TMB]
MHYLRAPQITIPRSGARSHSAIALRNVQTLASCAEHSLALTAPQPSEPPSGQAAASSSWLPSQPALTPSHDISRHPDRVHYMSGPGAYTCLHAEYRSADAAPVALNRRCAVCLPVSVMPSLGTQGRPATRAVVPTSRDSSPHIGPANLHRLACWKNKRDASYDNMIINIATKQPRPPPTRGKTVLTTDAVTCPACPIASTRSPAPSICTRIFWPPCLHRPTRVPALATAPRRHRLRKIPAGRIGALVRDSA